VSVVSSSGFTAVRCLLQGLKSGSPIAGVCVSVCVGVCVGGELL